jgi:ElaB/YqjD/DUF883 family membrane-anchored ribosome-binding protein
MSKHTHDTHTKDHADSVAHNAQALVAATSDMVDEKVSEVRNRLSAAMEAAKETYSAVQEKAMERAKAADKVIRGNPYQAIGIAFGVGALVGFLCSRRKK